MSNEEKSRRLKELELIEATLKTRRDFAGLIQLCDEVLTLNGSLLEHIDRLPQKAYYYARLGKKNAAIEAVNQFYEYKPVLDDKAFETKMLLLHLFIDALTAPLTTFQENQLVRWIQGPLGSVVTDTVFDHQSIVGPVELFNSERLNCKQTSFNDELLQHAFFSTQREREKLIYYNKETNDLQELVDGYLVSILPSRKHEKRQLPQRIAAQEAPDNIIEGIHYLIAPIRYGEFLKFFNEHTEPYDGIDDFLKDFEDFILQNSKGQINYIDHLPFTYAMSEIFFPRLIEWTEQQGYDKGEMEDTISEIITDIAETLLYNLNKEPEPDEAKENDYAFILLTMEDQVHLRQLVMTNIIPDHINDELLINPQQPTHFFIKGAYLYKIYHPIFDYVVLMHAVRNSPHGAILYTPSILLWSKLKKAPNELAPLKPEWREILRPVRFN